MRDEFYKLLVEFFGEGNVEIIAPNRLEQTVENMLSSDYKKRFKAEYQQTLIRYQNLCAYIKEIEMGDRAHTSDINLMKEQRSCMQKYLNVLLLRSSAEGLELL